MSESIFVDTNILIYAHDLDAGDRHETARSLIEGLWQEGGGVISVQVLQELYVNITRKIPVPLAKPQARALIETYAIWEVVVPSPADLLRASEIEDRYGLSFWDAMIATAALKADAHTLWTEDLNHGQIIEGLQVLNPLYS